MHSLITRRPPMPDPTEAQVIAAAHAAVKTHSAALEAAAKFIEVLEAELAQSDRLIAKQHKMIEEYAEKVARLEGAIASMN